MESNTNAGDVDRMNRTARGTNDETTRGGALIGSDRTIDLARGADRGAITELPIKLPPMLAISDSAALYYAGPAEEGSDGGIGIEFKGDDAVTWLPPEEALAIARGILARLEPAALVPRTLTMGKFPADASREELVASAAAVIAEDDRPFDVRKAYAEGILDGLNNTLEQLGYRASTLDELVTQSSGAAQARLD